MFSDPNPNLALVLTSGELAEEVRSDADTVPADVGAPGPG
jgi:hypothetical protein